MRVRIIVMACLLYAICREGKIYAVDFYHLLEIKEQLNYFSIDDHSLLNKDNRLDCENFMSRSMADIEFKLSSWGHDFCIRDTGIWSFSEDDNIESSDANNYLREAYFTLRLPWSTIIDVGKRNHIEGISYAWNPTDFFYQTSEVAGYDMDNETIKKTREGAVLLKGMSFLDFGTFTVIASPEIEKLDTNEKIKYFGKFESSFFSDYNPALVYFYNGRHHTGINLSGQIGDNLVVQFEGSLTRGSDINMIEKTGSPDPIQRYRIIERNGDFFVKTVLGANWNIFDNVSFIMEYFYNPEGYSDPYWDDLYDYLEDINAGRATPILLSNIAFDFAKMGQHYLFLRLNKRDFFTQDLEATSLAIINLQDGSYSLIPKLDYKFAEHFQASFFANIIGGKERSEFGLLPYKFITAISLSYFL